MDDIKIILETSHEYILKGLKNKSVTLIFSVIISIIIVYLHRILLYLDKTNHKELYYIYNNNLFKLVYIGFIIYIYQYNSIIGIF